MEKIEVSDRYSALGIRPPNPKTVCEGQCEGTGWIPHYKGDGKLQMEQQEGDDVLDEFWEEAHKISEHKTDGEIIKRCNEHKKEESAYTMYDCENCITRKEGVCDGWHFLKCPDCKGTGKK